MDELDNNSYCKPLVGLRLRSVEATGPVWSFVFAEDISILDVAPWRLLDGERIIVTSEDHGHPFGLPAPVDAVERVLAVVSGKTVVAAYITRTTSDLIVDFGGGVHLQCLQMSCGYESWRLEIRGSETICTGGGSIAHFP
jgi:hypothetical protein